MSILIVMILFVCSAKCCFLFLKFFLKTRARERAFSTLLYPSGSVSFRSVLFLCFCILKEDKKEGKTKQETRRKTEPETGRNETRTKGSSKRNFERKLKRGGSKERLTIRRNPLLFCQMKQIKSFVNPLSTTSSNPLSTPL